MTTASEKAAARYAERTAEIRRTLDRSTREFAEAMSAAEAARGFAILLGWIAALSLLARAVWARLGAKFITAKPAGQMAHRGDDRDGITCVGDIGAPESRGVRIALGRPCFAAVRCRRCWSAQNPRAAITTSEIKVSVLIHEDETELAVRVLHTAYGLDAE